MKIYSAILFILACSQVLYGQVLVGPTIGAQSTWIAFDDKDYKDFNKVVPSYGFHVGGNLSFRVQKRFFLHTTLLYSQKTKTIKGVLDDKLQNRLRNNFIEMPIMYTVEFKGHAGKGNKEFKWYLGAGPNLSYWLGGKGKISSSDLIEQNIDELEYKVVFRKSEAEQQDNQMNVADPNRMQLGLNLSAGIVFEPLGDQKYMLTARYELGHSFYSRTSNGTFKQTVEYEDIMQVRNHGIWISLAYLIDLKTDQRKRGKSTLDNKRK